MRITHIDWFGFVWLGTGVVMGLTDKVSWWVLLLVFLSHCKVTTNKF